MRLSWNEVHARATTFASKAGQYYLWYNFVDSYRNPLWWTVIFSHSYYGESNATDSGKYTCGRIARKLAS